MIRTIKRCPSCKSEKPADQFYRRVGNNDGLDGYCIPCRKAKAKAEYDRNKATYAAYAKSPRGIEAQARFRASQKGRNCAFAKHLRAKFGMTLEQHEAMYRKQNGLCAICGEMNLNGKRLCVDHNHATGRVRGLLCDKCNFMIGRISEDWRILDSAKEYLEFWGRIGVSK